jgi:hypothetical protein
VVVNRTIGWIDLYWIPLGAGGHFVRFNGAVYEAVTALTQHRSRRDLYHSALVITLPIGRFTVEMTPVPASSGDRRGVVAEGSVGAKALGRFRIFRYEVRRWHDGVIPDLRYAVGSPIRVTNDEIVAERVFDALPDAPILVWGRDEFGVGEMWSCNSIISWALSRAGLAAGAIPLPARARAPGWDAGISIARRGDLSSPPRPAAVTDRAVMEQVGA